MKETEKDIELELLVLVHCCIIFYMNTVFSVRLGHHNRYIAWTQNLLTTPKRKNPIKCHLQGHNKLVCLLEPHTIAFTLSNKQGS